MLAPWPFCRMGFVLMQQKGLLTCPNWSFRRMSTVPMRRKGLLAAAGAKTLWVLPAFVCGGSWLWDSFPYGLFDSSGVQGER